MCKSPSPQSQPTVCALTWCLLHPILMTCAGTRNRATQRVILDYFCYSSVSRLDRNLLNLPKVASYGYWCYLQKNNILCMQVQLPCYPQAAFCVWLKNTCMTLLNWISHDGRSWATVPLKCFRSLFPPLPFLPHQKTWRTSQAPPHSWNAFSQKAHCTSNYYSMARKAVNSRKWQFTQMEVKMHFLLYLKEITAFSKDLNPSNKHYINAKRSSLC